MHAVEAANATRIAELNCLEALSLAQVRELRDLQQYSVVLTAKMELVIEKGADCRRENLPTANEIALITPESD